MKLSHTLLICASILLAGCPTPNSGNPRDSGALDQKNESGTYITIVDETDEFGDAVPHPEKTLGIVCGAVLDSTIGLENNVKVYFSLMAFEWDLTQGVPDANGRVPDNAELDVFVRSDPSGIEQFEQVFKSDRFTTKFKFEDGEVLTNENSPREQYKYDRTLDIEARSSIPIIRKMIEMERSGTPIVKFAFTHYLDWPSGDDSESVNGQFDLTGFDKSLTDFAKQFGQESADEFLKTADQYLVEREDYWQTTWGESAP